MPAPADPPDTNPQFSTYDRLFEPNTLYGYRDWGSSDPLARSRRVDPKKRNEVHAVLVAEALASLGIPP
jgi:hypothetical protein